MRLIERTALDKKRRHCIMYPLHFFRFFLSNENQACYDREV